MLFVWLNKLVFVVFATEILHLPTRLLVTKYVVSLSEGATYV